MFFTLFVSLFLNLQVRAQSLELVSGQFQKTLSLQVMKSKFKSETVTIEDPIFKTTIKYDAFKLSDVLSLMIPAGSEVPSEILFSSQDGYSPTLAFNKVREFEGYLAFREHGKKDGSFHSIPNRKNQTAAPFYIVWKKAGEEKELPWVYQLTKIQSINWNQAFALLIPKGVAPDSPEMKSAFLHSRCAQV